MTISFSTKLKGAALNSSIEIKQYLFVIVEDYVPSHELLVYKRLTLPYICIEYDVIGEPLSSGSFQAILIYAPYWYVATVYGLAGSDITRTPDVLSGLGIE